MNLCRGVGIARRPESAPSEQAKGGIDIGRRDDYHGAEYAVVL
jgi:hypothetical protein